MLRRQSLLLILTALLGAALFALTDPAIAQRVQAGHGANLNQVDAAQNAFTGTVIGLSGCALAALAGMWLASRKMG